MEVMMKEDIISTLPDELLINILSLLPDSDAYRTRVLSNRWNHLCFFLPSLFFSYEEKGVEAVNKFYDFVDKTFSLRNRDMSIIKKFFLSCSYDYHRNRILDWLHIVFRSKKVQTLELRLISKIDRDRFCLSMDLLMLCNNALVDLTLNNVDMVALDETQLLFPCLKKLKLESTVYLGDQTPHNLISACPVLQELFLHEQMLQSQLHVFKISSPSLKRLTIRWRFFGKHEVVIDAPKLEYLYISSPVRRSYSLTNPWCLVEAHINIYLDSDIKVFTSVSSVRILTLTSASLVGLSHNEGVFLPVFPNLVKLIVEFTYIPAWDMLFVLLNNMPSLQHITISLRNHESPFKRRWKPPTEAPACLRFMVKEVVILNQDVVQVKDHVTLMRYLLSHSSVLENLTSSPFNIETQEKLLKFKRLSKSCRIEFV